MEGIILAIGIVLGVFNMKHPKSLRSNIIRRLVFLAVGFGAAFLLDRDFLHLSGPAFLAAALLGLGFLTFHLLIGGVKLRKEDLGPGLYKTSLLLYLIELPAEEFLYRLTILLPARGLFGPWPAVLLSTVVFFLLHLKTWDKRMIWVGSAVLGLSCGIIAVLANSVWTAVIVHNLNNFAFLTLIGKRNLFSPTAPTDSV